MGSEMCIRDRFLDVTPLMPPARLRFSKMLGRPLMGEIGCNCCGLVTLGEALRLDCDVAGQYGRLIHFLIGAWPFPSLAIWRGPARDAPADLVGVSIFSSEDAEFGEAWRAKCGAPWPNHWIDDELVYDTHPELLRLEKLYNVRCQEWKIAKQRRLEAADLHACVRHILIDGDCPDCGAAFVV